LACWLRLGGRGGWGRGTRRKSRSAVRPSRWRLCVRAHARQCLASNAPSPLEARERHPWRPTVPRPHPPRPSIAGRYAGERPKPAFRTLRCDVTWSVEVNGNWGVEPRHAWLSGYANESSHAWRGCTRFTHHTISPNASFPQPRMAWLYPPASDILAEGVGWPWPGPLGAMDGAHEPPGTDLRRVPAKATRHPPTGRTKAPALAVDLASSFRLLISS